MQCTKFTYVNGIRRDELHPIFLLCLVHKKRIKFTVTMPEFGAFLFQII